MLQKVNFLFYFFRGTFGNMGTSVQMMLRNLDTKNKGAKQSDEIYIAEEINL